MKKNGLQPIEKWSHFFPYKNPENLPEDCREAIYQEAPEIFAKCSAVVCASDALSVHLLQYAHEHNIPPISIVSFDNNWRHRSWELTSVRYPTLEIAMKAFQLIQLSQKKDSEDNICWQVPGVLNKRLSTAQCKTP